MDDNGIDYGKVLEDLEERRAKIEGAILGIKAILGISPQGPTAASSAESQPPSPSPPTTVRSDTFFGCSATEASVKFLQMVKSPQKTQQIADALERGGFKVLSGNPLAVISTGLNRDEKRENGQIVKLSRGEWGLREWYPNHRRNRSAKSRGKDDEADQESAESAS